MPDSRETTPSRHRLPIRDQEALTRVLRHLEETKGSQEEAAKALGLSQGSFSKLATGKRNEISFATYSRIMGELGGEARIFGRAPRPILEFGTEPEDFEVEQVRQAVRRGRGLGDKATAGVKAVVDELRQAGVADPEVSEIRDRLTEFSSRQAWKAAEVYDAFQRAIHADEHTYAWGNWEAWMRDEIRGMKRRAEPILRDLWGRDEWRGMIQKFLANVERESEVLPEPEDLRCWLALYRAVLPLADWDETWEIEPSWLHLRGTGELAAYLEAALTREDLLLRPRRDEERVRRADPPVSYSEWLARGLDFEDEGGTKVDLELFDDVPDDEGSEGGRK
jgi:predicted XRE-type DNA-binding protein